MKKVTLITSTLIGSLLCGHLFAGEIKDVVPEVVLAAADSVVVQAVKKQNDDAMSADNIQELDKIWMSAKEPTAFMKSLTSNAAAQVLTKLEKSKPYFVEFILTDIQGANVAITGMTSDYWQGDEPKFSNAYANGKGNVYIARPQRDRSTGEIISQVSVPVMSEKKAITTLTVGVRPAQLK